MNSHLYSKIVLISAFSLSISAFADEPTNWTGFYGSAMIGKTVGNNENKDGTVSYLLANGLVDRGAIYPIEGNKSTFQGINGTIKVGYNKQIDNNLVGAELGASWQDLKANNLMDKTYPAFAQTKIDTYQTASLRLGHIFNENTLAYVTGGAAIGQIKSKLSDLTRNWTYAPYDTLSDSKTELGYVVGFGIEHKLSERFSLRANYEYVDFGKVNFDYLQPFLINTGDDATSIQQSKSIHFSNLSAGISYSF